MTTVQSRAGLNGRAAGVDLDAAELAAQTMLEALGIDTSVGHLVATPRRMVRALAELTEGLHADPAVHLNVQFPPETRDPGLIVVRRVPFTAVCEHHVLAFTGRATVGYIPAVDAPIVGLSKLARLVRGYAARPQVQERLGQQVVEAIDDHMDVVAAGCVITSAHTCMTLRGARAEGAEMVSSHLVGKFRSDAATRGEFMALA
jgi:GTP cyclohydrolase I